MSSPVIICVDDQPEVLAAVSKDLDRFADACEIVECDSAEEALSLLEEYDQSGQGVAVLVVDCVMPAMSGVAFLSQVHADTRFEKTRSILLTGQASHGDTIAAINDAHIQRYMSKPWKADELCAVVSTQLTHWIFSAGLNHQDFAGLLDADVILDNMRL